MVKYFMILIMLLCLVGCAEIKPMQLPQYYAPDFSKVVRPEIPKLEEGSDYTFDLDNGRVCYTASGQNKLTAKVISEKTAWQEIEMIKQIVDIQSEIIKQKDQLIIAVDLQRQYAERSKTYSDVKAVIAEVIAVVAIALALAL